MSEGNDQSYIGVEQEDGNIKIVGPLSEEAKLKKLKAEKGSTVAVKAQSKGAAILKVLLNILNNEKTKPKQFIRNENLCQSWYNHDCSLIYNPR